MLEAGDKDLCFYKKFEIKAKLTAIQHKLSPNGFKTENQK